MDDELEKIPGALWNFSQPIADNMEEAVSGVKGQLAIKIYGDDLRTLEAKGDEIVNVMKTVPGVADLGLFRVIGQPNLDFTVDRDQAARYGLNVADVQDAIETAVGGKAVSQVLARRTALRPRGALPDALSQYEGSHRKHPAAGAVGRARFAGAAVPGSRAGWRVGDLPRRQLALRRHQVQRAGARFGQHRRRSDQQSGKQVKLPVGYHIDWAGEYESQKRSTRRLLIVLPLTILVICMILYTMFKSFKWVVLILGNVAMAPIGGLLALLVTGTHFSVSSGVGFLALFGVAVQTGVIMLEYINQLRARGHTIRDAAVEGSVLRLRPIMMTMLVASVGLLPAALSRGIGSDSQRPFAIVIVGGLIAALILGVYLLPTLYVWAAGDNDVLAPPDPHTDPIA